jgi:gustatory receptor
MKNFRIHFPIFTQLEKMTSESFNNVFSPVLRVTKYFGIMPLSIENTNDPKKIDFKWKSVKTIYCLVFLVFASIECALSFRIALKEGLALGQSSGTSYHFVSSLGGFLLLNLARKWPTMIFKWNKSEEVFITQTCYHTDGLSLKTKI